MNLIPTRRGSEWRLNVPLLVGVELANASDPHPTLIIQIELLNHSGSPKGAKDCFRAIAPHNQNYTQNTKQYTKPSQFKWN